MEFHLFSTSNDWFGFGLDPPTPGTNAMIGADIILVVPSQNSVTDSYGVGESIPESDVSLGGTNDFYNVSVSFDGSLTHAEVWRAFNTTDRYDVVITTDFMTVIWAKSANQLVPMSMPPNHGSMYLNFFTGVLNTTMTESDTVSSFLAMNLKYLHGSYMAITWGYVNVIGVWFPRYFRHKSWWLSVHRLVMTIGTTGTLSMVLAALSFVNDGNSAATIHLGIGLIIASLTFIQSLVGTLSVYYFTDKKKVYYQYLRKFHIFNGGLLLLMSIVQIYFGEISFFSFIPLS